MKRIFPRPELAGKIRGSAGNQNVPRVPDVHNALRYIDSSSRHVLLIVNVLQAADWAAMNTHPQLQIGSVAQRFGNLKRALNWGSRIVEEDKSHTVAGRQPQELGKAL